MKRISSPLLYTSFKSGTRLQEVLCDLSRYLSPRGIIARKILAIDLIIALGSRQELQTHKPRLTRLPLSTLKQQTLKFSPQLPKFPVVCEKTQCIFYLGNEQLTYEQRTFRFSRVSHMMDHVERVHLKHQQVTERVVCHHPVCISRGLVLQNVNHFKNLVQVEHGFILREPVNDRAEDAGYSGALQQVDITLLPRRGTLSNSSTQSRSSSPVKSIHDLTMAHPPITFFEANFKTIQPPKAIVQLYKRILDVSDGFNLLPGSLKVRDLFRLT
jgi:hypothetical protein